MKKKKFFKLYEKLLLTFLCLLLIIIIIFLSLYLAGEFSLNKPLAGNVPDVTGDGIADKVITYNGDKYRFNDGIISILFIGTDVKEGIANKKEDRSLGQADGLILLIINTHTNTVSIVNINRNTIADMEIYDENNEYLKTLSAQITLSHAYGDGKEISCLNTVRAVSKLFNDIPINGYISMDISAVPTINDMLGGVEVTVIEEVVDSTLRIHLAEGETIRLKGNEAYVYVQHRDTRIFDSNASRLKRQKSYLKALANTLKEQLKQNISILPKLFKSFKENTISSLKMPELIYLSQAGLYDINTENIISVNGKVKMGLEYEEFYMDSNSLTKNIVKLFYEPF